MCSVSNLYTARHVGRPQYTTRTVWPCCPWLSQTDDIDADESDKNKKGSQDSGTASKSKAEEGCCSQLHRFLCCCSCYCCRAWQRRKRQKSKAPPQDEAEPKEPARPEATQQEGPASFWAQLCHKLALRIRCPNWAKIGKGIRDALCVPVSFLRTLFDWDDSSSRVNSSLTEKLLDPQHKRDRSDTFVSLARSSAADLARAQLGTTRKASDKPLYNAPQRRLTRKRKGTRHRRHSSIHLFTENTLEEVRYAPAWWCADRCTGQW